MGPRRAELYDRTALDARFSDLRQFDNILLAVSGGADSSALLHLIGEWVTTAGLQPGLPTVLTVDHGLRQGSADEAEHVAREAGRLGLPHETLKWHGEKPASGVQARAREARYRLMCDYAAGLTGSSVIVTGHTLDDQAETVLMRLARGSGPDGLAGVAARAQLDHVEIHRPLLDLTHDQLIGYLRDRDLSWIEDPSNDAVEFERVRVRKARQARRQLGLNDGALGRTAQRMARARDALEAATDVAARELIAASPHLACGVLRWQDDQRRELAPEIAIRLLRRLVHSLGGQDQPPPLGQTEDLDGDLRAPQFSGATLAGCRLMRRPDARAPEILLFREVGRFHPVPVPLQAGEPIVWDRRFVISCDDADAQALTVRPCDETVISELAAAGGSSLPVELPHAALLALPAVWRDEEPVALPSLGWFRGQVAVRATFCVETLIHSRRRDPGRVDASPGD